MNSAANATGRRNTRPAAERFYDLATVKTLMTREDFLASLEYQVKFFMDRKQIKTAPDLHKAIVTDLL